MFRIPAIVLSLALLAGCETTKSGETPDVKGAAKAEALYAQGKYTDAMVECIDLTRKDPQMPGLAEIQAKIVRHIADERARAATLQSPNTFKSMAAEVDDGRNLPSTYGVRRGIMGETKPMRTIPNAMEKAMQKKVTVHLEKVNLSDFIMAIGNTEGVNIVCDNIDNSKTMTIHAENVPLQEILDYVSRNLAISFFIGDNVIWATPRDAAQPRLPLETRLYRLRKGISSEELADATKLGIVQAIERFVPKVEGSDMLFDKKTHVLIVRNTRDNIARVEEIIENMDVCPPQVLIEARFIATKVDDLRELGVDWLLNSPIIVTRKNTLANNVVISSTESQIDQDGTIDFTPFSSQAQGLNMTYQGLLTDPMFKAVIHALEASGKSRTLSAPKVTTVNNRPASIRIGEDFRYFEEYEVQSIPSSVTDAGSQVYSSVLVPVGTPQLEELGIELNVTPSVGADMSSVNLNIVPQISEFVRYEQYEVSSGNNNANTTTGTATNNTSLVKLPIFKRSKIETEVIVQSGETVVMGGLISSAEVKDVEQVPFLSSLPFIGRFFKHDTVAESKENLLIFVTATILSDRGESLVPMIEEPAEQAGTTGQVQPAVEKKGD